MELTYIGNVIEGVFWVVFSLPFWWGLLRRGEKQRKFCGFGGVVFVLFAGTDFWEAQTGAWWRPWWLLAGKGICIAGIIIIVFWYIRIYGSIPDAIAALKGRRQSDTPES